VNDRGEVVAINVAGNPDAPAQTYAVPINIAKEFLKTAHITLDLGPQTEHWRAGHQAFAREEYTLAKKEFEAVKPLWKLALITGLSEESSSERDPVQEMVARCEAEIQAGHDRTSVWQRLRNSEAVSHVFTWGGEHQKLGALLLGLFLLGAGGNALRRR
jgi:hypothetical protein